MLEGHRFKLLIRISLLIISSLVFTPTVILAADNLLKSKVKYNAKDSIRLDLTNQKLYLFGKAEVIYTNLKINAGYIELDLKNNIALAKGRLDSAGKDIELPVFTEGGQIFNVHQLKYNFQTKKGLINGVITKEADGYIHGETVKKDSSTTVYIRNGKYTTCDLEHPHFYIQAQKLKVIPNDKIVTGPAYLVLNDIPTPLCVPFGLFPNTSGRKSGIIIPSYGQSATQGFFLKNGGFYWGLSNYMDASFTGDIYTRGSWGAKTHVNYIRKYKYTGSFDFSYAVFNLGDPLFKSGTSFFTPDQLKYLSANDPMATYSTQNNFMLIWTHRQDSKANPGSSFSASVNAGSSNYNALTATNPSIYLNNSLNSNINFSKYWEGTPFNFSIAARHSQSTVSKTISISLPQIDFSINRIYPFKNNNDPIPHWYDKIGLSYTSQLVNTVNTTDSMFLKPQMFNQQVQSGFHHSIPISTSFNIFKYFTVTPSIVYNGSAYPQYISMRYDSVSRNNLFKTDTVKRFAYQHDISFSTQISTKIYGNYQFKKGYFRHIRHLLVPSLNFTYRPDFSASNWGYRTVSGDTNKTPVSQVYSKFGNNYYNSIWGVPPSGKSGVIGWSLSNTIEAKVYDPKDSLTHIKKISIIDMLSISSGYNAAVVVQPWQSLNINARTKLFKVLDINVTAIVDPYAVDNTGKRLNELELDKDGRLGRLTNATLALGTTLRSKTGAKKKAEFAPKTTLTYVDFNVPWSLNMMFNYNYSNSFNNSLIGASTITQTKSLIFNGDFSATAKWKVGFTSGFDFTFNQLTYTQLNIYRDLHCWEMRINWVPFGPRQMYMITIKVKSAVLQDLKLNRTRQWYDYYQ